MTKSAIKVYARLKPEKNQDIKTKYEIHRRPNQREDKDYMILTAPPKLCSEYIDNRPESWQFPYHRIFGETSQQESIFEYVARPVINNVLEGYNGTIFAYGQTGSGKTYTITGDRLNYENRGILPRTLEYLFDFIRKHPENLYAVEVAYLEIYNENGYDLLDRKQQWTSKVEDLSRVSIQEDEAGSLHLKNLSFRRVFNEKDALNLVFTGDNNRVTSVTPMNPESSRSHCIFTIIVLMKRFGTDHYRRAKIHLVDLAGSERVCKCAITGTILTEAKHINLSLHFLEQVIVCLSRDNVNHVPYRNSLLTAILRDSLGGNCLTTMLATLSISTMNLEETISTCRFAQRVSLIKNNLQLVLEKDLHSENTLLKMENDKLKQQLDMINKQLMKKNENKIYGSVEMNKYTQTDSNNPSIWKEFENVKGHLKFCKTSNTRYTERYPDNLEYYKSLIMQRDEEISSLLELLNKNGNLCRNCTANHKSLNDMTVRENRKQCINSLNLESELNEIQRTESVRTQSSKNVNGFIKKESRVKSNINKLIVPKQENRQSVNGLHVKYYSNTRNCGKRKNTINEVVQDDNSKFICANINESINNDTENITVYDVQMKNVHRDEHLSKRSQTTPDKIKINAFTKEPLEPRFSTYAVVGNEVKLDVNDVNLLNSRKQDTVAHVHDNSLPCLQEQFQENVHGFSVNDESFKFIDKLTESFINSTKTVETQTSSNSLVKTTRISIDCNSSDKETSMDNVYNNSADNTYQEMCSNTSCKKFVNQSTDTHVSLTKNMTVQTISTPRATGLIAKETQEYPRFIKTHDYKTNNISSDNNSTNRYVINTLDKSAMIVPINESQSHLSRSMQFNRPPENVKHNATSKIFGSLEEKNVNRNSYHDTSSHVMKSHSKKSTEIYSNLPSLTSPKLETFTCSGYPQREIAFPTSVSSTARLQDEIIESYNQKGHIYENLPFDNLEELIDSDDNNFQCQLLTMGNQLPSKNSLSDNVAHKNEISTIREEKNISLQHQRLPLTGDPEIDDEIIAFYKAKRAGGIY